MYARIYHSYTRLVPVLAIVRKPTVWDVITSQYPGIHDIGLPGDSTACREATMPAVSCRRLLF